MAFRWNTSYAKQKRQAVSDMTPDVYNRGQIDKLVLTAKDYELLEVALVTRDVHAQNSSMMTWSYQVLNGLTADGKLGEVTLAHLRGEDAEEYMLGIDVSHWQGDINWQRVNAAGYKYAWIKATQGDHWTDPKIEVNSMGAEHAGLKVGYYHYLDTEHGASATRQSYHFNQVTKTLAAPTLGVALDIEKQTELSREDYTAMCQQVAYAMDVVRGGLAIYTSKRIVDRDLKPDHDLGKYPLWAPRYNTTNTPPDVPTGWDKWSIWQYTSKGSVDGVESNCDINRAKRSWWESLT